MRLIGLAVVLILSHVLALSIAEFLPRPGEIIP
jgi:hypothetical protein